MSYDPVSDPTKGDMLMKPKTIIFLDIDGVLNSQRSAVSWYAEHGRATPLDFIDPELLSAFERFISRLEVKRDVQIVISSTWRKTAKYEDFKRFLGPYLFEKIDPNSWRTGANDRGVRGKEVDDWMYSTFGYDTTHPEYLCIDDDGDFFQHQPLYQTSHKIGFTDDCINGALKTVGKKPTKEYEK